MNHSYLTSLSIPELEKMAKCMRPVYTIEEMEIYYIEAAIKKILSDFFYTGGPNRKSIKSIKSEIIPRVILYNIPRLNEYQIKNAMDKTLCYHIKNFADIIENAYIMLGTDMSAISKDKNETEIASYLFSRLVNGENLPHDISVYMTCYFNSLFKAGKINQYNKFIPIVDLIKSSGFVNGMFSNDRFFYNLKKILNVKDNGTLFFTYIGFFTTLIMIYFIYGIYNKQTIKTIKDINFGSLKKRQNKLSKQRSKKRSKKPSKKRSKKRQNKLSKKRSKKCSRINT